MKPSDVLEAAIPVIRERGWWGGELKGPEGQVCLLGACWVALGQEPPWVDEYPSPQEVFSLKRVWRQVVGGSPTVWNDDLWGHPGHDPETDLIPHLREVIEMLKRAGH